MKFVVSSPDSFLLNDSSVKNRSKSEQIMISILAIVAIGSQVGMFVMMQNLMGQVG